MAKRLPPDRHQRAKTYREFLKRFNRLTDRSWYDAQGDRPRKLNSILEYRRNGNYKWPVCSEPNLVQIDAHLNRFSPDGRKHDTIFFINDCSFTNLICLIDIDTDDDPAAAQALAEYVAQRWLNGQAFIDLSPGGLGRHVYFLVNSQYDQMNRFSGKEIRALLRLLKISIQKDPMVQTFKGAKVCTLLGEPTYWRKDSLWYVDYRGSVVKAPYFRGDVEGGIKKFVELEAFRLLAVHRAVVKRASRENTARQDASSIFPPSLGKPYMGVTTPEKKLEGLNGPEKKRLCVKSLCHQLNRLITVDEAMVEYQARYQPTGSLIADVVRRHREMTEMVAYYNSTFRPAKGKGSYQFSRTKYLDLCRNLVPLSAFEWKRREKLDHQRLADFIAVKIQDAFFRKEKYIARASRDATVKNMQGLKAKGLIDWALNAHTYKKLLDVAVAYGLLHVYDGYTPPTRGTKGEKIAKGMARMVGPGKALEQEWLEFQPIYQACQRSIVPDFLLD